MPAPAPVPLRLRRWGGGLRGSGPGCGFGGSGPGPARGGPGCGPVVRLGDCAGSPPVGPAAAAPRGPPLRRGRARRPGGLASPGAAVPGPLVLRPPPGLCGPPCGGGGPLGLSVGRCAHLVPPWAPPALPPPCGRGWPFGPPGLLHPGGGWAALTGRWYPLPPPVLGSFPGTKKALDRMERLCYYDGAGSAMRTPPSGQQCPPVVYRGPCWAVFLCLDRAFTPFPPPFPLRGKGAPGPAHPLRGCGPPPRAGTKKPGRGLPRPGKQNLYLFC